MDRQAKAQGDPLLAEALGAAREGNLQRARDLAEKGLQEGISEPIALHAFLGMVLARAGSLAESAAHLKEAYASRHGDVTIACNLISVLMDQQRDAEALEVASRELAHADESLRIARFRGFLAQKLELFEEAADAYRVVLAGAPQDFECWNNLGNALVAVEDYEGAVEALGRAVSLDRTAAPARLNLAAAQLGLEKADAAEATLTETAQDFPDDPRPHYQLYLLYKSQLKQDEAIAELEQAAKLDPDDADFQLKLGIEYGVVRRTDDAERAYRRTIELNPPEADAYIGLAIQYEHTNREDQFAPLIELARAKGVDEGPLAFIEALELRRAGRFEEALARLDSVPSDVEPIRTVHVRATLLERLSRTDEAFAAHSEANRLMEDNPTDPLGRAEKLRADIARDIALLSPEWRDSWQAAEIADGFKDPVFLVGFPRSGTTLLDTILMGHPQTVVMEEQPPLNHVEEALGGQAALPALDSKAIAKARAQYLAEVESLQPVEPGKLLIDKSPLFLYRLPLIQRLFPKARIILALRHPCDVVLSCFMSNFRLNSAMANFLRLEDAAALYDLSFRHWQASLGLFPANVRTIAYERLVEDVEGQVRPLLDWLGLQWDENVLDHRATAKSRGLITTASYSQVTEPIYRRASGRWLRYREYLAPVLDVLAPWAIEFDYGDPREESANA